MNSSRIVFRMLARHFAGCEIVENDLAACARGLCGGKSPRWILPVARRLVRVFGESARPRWKEIEEQLRLVPELSRALRKKKAGEMPDLSSSLSLLQSMRPVPTASSWGVLPAVDFPGLAKGLELHPDDLGWLISHSEKTEHYHYRWHRKGRGRAPRLIEIPKPLLKTTQEVILDSILRPIPLHEASCGFERGKSIFDFVRPHCGKKMVLKLDLKDFFPGIGSGRVARLFLTAGYPEYVADLLTRLTTNSVSAGENSPFQKVRIAAADRNYYEKPHLPQGAASSPALANLCAFRLDCRLSGLARSMGVDYTRYADDLLFSGGEVFSRSVHRFFETVIEIVITGGFRINLHKTRFMPSGQRQHAAGLVLNEKPNVRRADFDLLKATLHNCVRKGAHSQNRLNHEEFRSHLAGRIEWISTSNPERGQKLRVLFSKIEW